MQEFINFLAELRHGILENGVHVQLGRAQVRFDISTLYVSEVTIIFLTP